MQFEQQQATRSLQNWTTTTCQTVVTHYLELQKGAANLPFYNSNVITHISLVAFDAATRVTRRCGVQKTRATYSKYSVLKLMEKEIQGELAKKDTLGKKPLKWRYSSLESVHMR